MTSISIKRVLLLALALSLALRLVLILTLQTYAHPVRWEFETLANNILAGNGYSFEFFHIIQRSYATPLYAFLCAAVYAVTNHNYFAILIIQCAFSVLLALTIFAMARKIFGESVALLAAACTAFHPGFVYYDVFNLLPLSIDGFLVAIITLLWLNSKEKPTVIRMLSIGGLIGIGILSRGIIGVLLPLILFYFLVFGGSLSIAHRLKIAACLTGAMLIVLAPWLIRNYIVHREFVFVTSSSAENFWRGNNPYATGTSVDEHKMSIFNRTPEDFKKKVYSMTEMEQKRFFEREALTFIRKNPSQAVGLYLKKVYYFWWFSSRSGTVYPQKYLVVYKPLYAIMAILFVAGFVRAMFSDRNLRHSSLMLMSVAVAVCLGQSLFYVEGRHRWLVEPILLIFLSYALAEIWKLIKAKLMRMPAIS